MRKITKLLTLALAVLMFVAMPVSAAFTDVSVEDEALYEAVELLSTLGVAKGTTETTFGPEELVTRQQMAAFVYRLMKAGRSSEGGVNTTAFTDLEDSTFFNMISWASTAGIIKGTSATTFNPKGNITYQDACVMLVRALGYEKDGALAYPFGYTDKAEDLGLDENIPSDVDYTDNLNRGNVAILLANAFYAEMNETTVDYEWVVKDSSDPDSPAAYVAVEKAETIAHKIFGVEEETFVVTATTHYGFNGVAALYNETTDVDLIKGNRYDEDGALVVANEEIEMDDLGLEGSSDDYFMAELTLFVKKDATDVADDKVIAAKSNLIKKTVTAADVAFETSARTDKEYYVDADKKNGDKVLTGYVTLGGTKAYLDQKNAPYSYRKLGDNGVDKSSVRFIDLTGGSYDEEHAIFNYSELAVNFDGTYAADATTGAYDLLTKAFDDAFPTVYNKGLYEADVYDVNGDGYAEYIFVKDYDFTQIVDKKNRSLGSNFTTTDGYNKIYTEDATIEGEYTSEDFVLAYVNFGASYVKVAETVTPIEAMVNSKITSDSSEAITFKTGEVVEFVDADKKFAGFNSSYDVSDFTPGKTYKAYIKDGVLLYQDSIASGDFDADADYAIILNYDEKSTKYREVGASGTTSKDDQIVYSATGVVDGEFVTYYYVNAVIDGAVKAVKLADYANTHYGWDGSVLTQNTNNDVESQKITDTVVAESIMFHDFLGKFSTYTIDSEGAYTFTALDFSTDLADLNDTDEEIAVYVTADASTMDHYTGSIYSATNLGVSRFTVKDYTQLIIKTVDDDGEDVYTLYTSANLPKFDETVFSKVSAVFVNNKSSNIENLGILYAEIDEFGSKATKDYRIVVGKSEIADENNKSETVINVLNIKDGTVASNIELAKSVASTPAVGAYVALTEDGKAETVSVGTQYVENAIFSATFGGYDTDNAFLTLVGDVNTYIVNEETTILLYVASDEYKMVEDDALTVEDNPYEELEDATTLSLDIVAEENEDNDSDDTIKIAKTIVIKA